METVYVVIGESGEYSDHNTWNIKAFHKKEPADKLAEELNQWCIENRYHRSVRAQIKKENYQAFFAMSDEPECPLDPQLHEMFNYNGVDYGVIEVPLGDE